VYVYYNPPPVTAGWTIDDISNGFIAPNQYTTNDIICHTNATAGKGVITVAAGSKVDLQWTVWPTTHHGPVITYLAPNTADSATQDKTALSFVKIDAGGLVNPTPAPGTWATDVLIATNNTWTVTIPAKIKAGRYVLRHEIIALQTGGDLNGAQNYPFCINLNITGTGTVVPTGGVKGTALYKPTDAGIHYDIYNNPNKTYPMPGPAIPATLK